jgi:hypothetical protein
MKPLTHHWLKAGALLVLVLIIAAIPVLGWRLAALASEVGRKPIAMRHEGGPEIVIPDFLQPSRSSESLREEQTKQFPWIPGVGAFNSSLGMAAVFCGLFLALFGHLLRQELREIRQIHRRHKRFSVR